MVHNEAVYQRAGVGGLATKVNRHRVALMGRILRREGEGACVAVTCDRCCNAQGARRPQQGGATPS